MQLTPPKTIVSNRKMADPAGTGIVGDTSGVDFSKTAAAHPIIQYRTKSGRSRFIVADLFTPPGVSQYLMIRCPLCENVLRISEDNKEFRYEPLRVPSFPDMRLEEVLIECSARQIGGTLSVERFSCTWEVEPSLRRKFGFAVCPWRVAIDNNIAKDA